MKKSSKAIGKDYSKCKGDGTELDYYGVLLKDGRARIDTKRYKKFFILPDEKIEHRKSVYYIPSKIHKLDYSCNQFNHELSYLKHLWLKEFKLAIEAIKTPKQIENQSRLDYLSDGIMDYDEANMAAVLDGIRRNSSYRYVIKSLYAQFFHQMMSLIDALCLRICVLHGYKEKDFTREKFDVFIQGKQKENALSFYEYAHYSIYDRAYRTWNFLKHNSSKSYHQLKSKYPYMIYDPEKKYKNGDPAISVLKIDENFILKCLNTLHLFFDEVCFRGFEEDPKDAKWDYDDYFIEKAKDQIDLITNPLGLPDFI